MSYSSKAWGNAEKETSDVSSDPGESGEGGWGVKGTKEKGARE